MDSIQNAIEKKLHISKNQKLNGQTWKEFFEVSINKKIFLFGVGPCADFFLKHFGSHNLQGIIDNDIKKQGFFVKEFLPEAWDNLEGELCVYDVDVLQKYSQDEVVILITSINSYEDIANQLSKYGIKNIFVLLIMEANKRIEENRTGYPVNSLDAKEIYAKQCCQQAIELKKVVFYSFGTYSDHGKYISERLLSIRNDLDIVWMVNDLNSQVPIGVRKVYLGNWKRYIYEMETAGIWIYNMVVPGYIIKRSEQVYIQTKHWASVTLKKFYLDASTVQDVPANVENWKYNSKIMDYIITGSDFDTCSCRRGFDFKGEIIQAGSPRSDVLFGAEKIREKVYDYYHIDSEIHTVIYAPTYRFNKESYGHQHEARGIGLDYEGVKYALEKRFGGEWNIVLRLHPSIAKDNKYIGEKDYIIDAGDYEDSEELVAACDAMISDYSSIMFEAAFVNKPVFLFALDQEEYINGEYDLLIEYHTLPFSIAETNEILCKNIEQFNEELYQRVVEEFLDKYGVHEDGKASERVAEFVSGLIAI